MSFPLRVLVVEDSEDDALLAVRALRRAGYSSEFEWVDSAERVQEALQSKQWDLVVCDHQMPQLDEVAVLRALRERGLEIPFIVLSRNMREEEVVTALREGAHEFVNKRELASIGIAVERAIREVTSRQERQLAQETLRKSEERYTLALSGSRDGIWDWDIQADRVYYSPRFKELLGLPEDESSAALNSLFDAVHEDDREAFQRAFDEHLTQRVPLEVEGRVRTKQGEHRWFSVRGQALWGDEGKAIRIAGSLSDVTDRKLAEERLKEKLTIIEQQQDAIRTLSTPIIEVWEGAITMPVLGTIDAVRAEQMMEVLLGAVVRTRCRHAVIDMTGVDAVDERTADHVIRLVRAVQLLGAQGIVVGIKPEVAQTMVSIGVDLSQILTLANLREALVLCMRARSPSKPQARRR